MTAVVILDIPATDETRDTVVATLREALEETRAFDGCEGLDLIVNQDDRSNVVVYERWASREHYARYRAWREETGFSQRFRAMFPSPPTVRVFDVERLYP